MLCLSLVAAQQTSSGRVHDQPGLPVPEASVIGLRDFARAQAQTYPWVGG